ncbi:hypothetical protein GCM10023147_04550 [Tsukamurella soli]|uniref:Uncharacterized protein n=1 Tax=Tsukamurella soli TaxID=644556 RepID=A0ABP8J399_9ACTN
MQGEADLSGDAPAGGLLPETAGAAGTDPFMHEVAGASELFGEDQCRESRESAQPHGDTPVGLGCGTAEERSARGIDGCVPLGLGTRGPRSGSSGLLCG